MCSRLVVCRSFDQSIVGVVDSFTYYLDEALVQGEIMADGVLPALLVLPVEGEFVDDELVDAVEGDLFVGRVGDGHGDERDVGVGRLDHVAVVHVHHGMWGGAGGSHGHEMVAGIARIGIESVLKKKE